MSRLKGELTPAAIDRGWPHQITLLAESCKNLLRCVRGHSFLQTLQCALLRGEGS